ERLSPEGWCLHALTVAAGPATPYRVIDPFRTPYPGPPLPLHSDKRGSVGERRSGGDRRRAAGRGRRAAPAARGDRVARPAPRAGPGHLPVRRAGRGGAAPAHRVPRVPAGA